MRKKLMIAAILLVLILMVAGCETQEIGSYSGQMELSYIMIGEEYVDLEDLQLAPIPVTFILEEDEEYAAKLSLENTDISMKLGQSQDKYFGDYQVSGAKAYYFQATADKSLKGDFVYEDAEREIDMVWSFELGPGQRKGQETSTALNSFISAFEKEMASKLTINPTWGTYVLKKGFVIVDQGWYYDQFIDIPGHLLYFDGEKHYLFPYGAQARNALVTTTHYESENGDQYYTLGGKTYRYEIEQGEETLGIALFGISDTVDLSMYTPMDIRGFFHFEEEAMVGELTLGEEKILIEGQKQLKE